MAKIKVNGKNQEIETPISIEDLIKLNKVENPELVSVQLNEKFILRNQYATTTLKEGDEVDFLYFMGGGSGLFFYNFFRFSCN